MILPNLGKITKLQDSCHYVVDIPILSTSAILVQISICKLHCRPILEFQLH